MATDAIMPPVHALEEAAKLQQAPKDKLTALQELGIKLQEQLKKVAKISGELEAANKELYKMQLITIPDAMAEVGMKSFKLEDGTTFEVEPFYSASIKEENRDKAHEWLEVNGHGGLIKNELTIDLGRGEGTDELVQEFRKIADEKEVQLSRKKSVHASTLKAWVKEMATKNQLPPLDIFGIFIGKKADVQTDKKSRR